jgi:hypothetical protein
MADNTPLLNPTGGGESRRPTFRITGIVGHQDNRHRQSGTRMGKRRIGDDGRNEGNVSCGTRRRFLKRVHLTADPSNQNKTANLGNGKTSKSGNRALPPMLSSLERDPQPGPSPTSQRWRAPARDRARQGVSGPKGTARAVGALYGDMRKKGWQAMQEHIACPPRGSHRAAS